MLSAALVAAVGAVDVNGSEIFNWACKNLKNLNFSSHLVSLFMGVFCFKIFICNLNLHILSN